MDSIDLSALEQSARRRYERARLVRSVLGFLPVVLLVLVATSLNRRSLAAATFGGVLFATGVVLLWRGRELAKGVLPGVASGLVPLSFALVANLGHGCAAGHCSTWCLPACTAGGVVAGVIVSTIGLRHRLGLGFWLGGASMSLLTGAMGCSCVGFSGVLGMLAGFATGLVPQVVRWRRAG